MGRLLAITNTIKYRVAACAYMVEASSNYVHPIPISYYTFQHFIINLLFLANAFSSNYTITYFKEQRRRKKIE